MELAIALVLGSIILAVALFKGLQEVDLNVKVETTVRASEVKKLEVGEAGSVSASAIHVEGLGHTNITGVNISPPDVKLKKK